MPKDVENNTINNEGGITGKGFKKGKSGNPGGRPKGSKGFKERCRAFADDEGLDTLIGIARDSDGKDRLKAVELLLAYGYGKPRQALDIGDGEGGPAKILLEWV